MRDLLLDDENAILSPVVVPPCRNRNRIHIAPLFPKAVVGGTKSRNVEHPTFNCLREPVCWLYVCARASHRPPILFTMLHFNDWCNSSFLNDIMGYQIASLICFFLWASLLNLPLQLQWPGPLESRTHALPIIVLSVHSVGFRDPS